jgi:hypothetical protein
VLFVKIIEGLGEAERKAIEAVGLGCLLRIPPVKIRRNLCRWIAERYKSELDAFVFGRDDMAQLTLPEVEHLLGLPARGRATLRPEVVQMFHEMKQKKKRRITFPELE